MFRGLLSKLNRYFNPGDYQKESVNIDHFTTSDKFLTLKQTGSKIQIFSNNPIHIALRSFRYWEDCCSVARKEESEVYVKVPVNSVVMVFNSKWKNKAELIDDKFYYKEDLTTEDWSDMREFVRMISGADEYRDWSK